MRAATLGLLGRIAEGQRAAADLLALKPDIPYRGRVLIGHYIKSEELVERTIEGLAQTGLALA